MLFLATLLLAQATPQQQCTTMDANLPAPLAAWATPGQGSPGDFSKPVVLASRAKSEIAGLPADTKDGGATEIDFRPTKAGTYGVAIDQGAWIDVVPDDGTALKSVSHGHGPECSTIRKIVRFDLQPGQYHIYVSGLTSTNVKLFVAEGVTP
jgi:hypothetical protein